MNRGAVPAPGTPGYARALHKAAADFEGVLIAKMFEVMRASVPKDGLLDDGMEKGTYEDMLFTQLSRVSAETQSVGIADMLYRSFTGDAPAIEPNKG